MKTSDEKLLVAALQRARQLLPKGVTDLRYELIDFPGDEEAVFVWIEMPEGARDLWSWTRTEEIRQIIRDTVRAELDIWPNIVFTEAVKLTAPASTGLPLLKVKESLV